MNNFLDLLLMGSVLFGGLYCIWLSFDIRKWTRLRTNSVLYPTGASPEHCLDPEGFKEFMPPRLMIFGILCLPAGLGFGLNMILPQPPSWLLLASIFLTLAAVGYYGVVINQAYRRFW